MKLQNRNNRRLMAATIFAGLALSSASAQAYIGPGLGVAMVWTLLGPVAALISAVALIAYFPLRYLYKKHKHKNQPPQDQNQEGVSAPDQDKK